MEPREGGSTGESSFSSAPRKKMKYLQKYNKAWEYETEFHGWLKQSSKGEMFAFCTACFVHLSVGAGKVEIRKHSSGKKHQENCSTSKKQPSVFSMPSVTAYCISTSNIN